MIGKELKKFTQCLRFIQVLAIFSSGLLISLSSLCKEKQIISELSLSALSPYYKVQDRSPGNYVSDVEIQTIPEKQKSWMESIFVEDDAGVLLRVRDQLKHWDDMANLAWERNLEGTGFYEEKTAKDRKDLINKNILKYVDKRISGEVKKAKKGSTLARVGAVQKQLKPQTNVGITKNFRLKMKARVLRGKAYVLLENPYFDNKTTLSATGKVNMEVGKNFKSVGLEAKSFYDVTDGSWVARLDKDLFDFTKARVSSTQSDSEFMFSESADKRFELLYSKGF